MPPVSMNSPIRAKQPGMTVEQAYQMMILAQEQANEFARTGIAHTIILNGGGILSFAPIGALFGIRISEVYFLAGLCLGSFTVGLILSTAAFLCGFLVNSQLSVAMQMMLIGNSNAENMAAIVRHNRTRMIGLVCAIGCMIMFVCGCAAGLLAVYFGYTSALMVTPT